MRTAITSRPFLAILAVVALATLTLAFVLRPGGPLGLLGAHGDDPSAIILYVPPGSNPLDDRPPDRDEAELQLRTMLKMLTSPRVLDSVALNSEIRSLESLRNTPSPSQFIRDRLVVRRGDDNTNLITVSARGLPSRDGAAIVNAVVREILNLEWELANARTHRSIREIEQYLEELEANLQSRSQRLAALGRVPLEPDGPPFARADLEADLRDCLDHLRLVRLERAGLPAPADGEAAPDTEARAALDRREALLLADRDRLADAIARATASEAERRPLLADLERLEATRRRLQDRLEALRFEERSSESRFTQITEAKADAR